MAAQWPRVVNRLITLLPTLPGWGGVAVFDGPLLDDSIATSYITVGFVADDLAGSYSQTQDPDGGRYQESGDVRCELVCMDIAGGVDLAGTRAAAFTLVGALEAAIRGDRRLGVLSPEGSFVLSVDVRSEQTAVGAFQTLVLTLTYFTVT